MSKSTHKTREAIEDKAAQLGLQCFFPKPNEIQIDLDDGAQLNERVLSVLNDNGLEVVSRLETKSKSGNTHVHLRFNKEFNAVARVALQACLGSDPVREILSFVRYGEGYHEISALFETPEGAPAVIEWRDKEEEAWTSSLSF